MIFFSVYLLALSQNDLTLQLDSPTWIIPRRRERERKHAAPIGRDTSILFSAWRKKIALISGMARARRRNIYLALFSKHRVGPLQIASTDRGPKFINFTTISQSRSQETLFKIVKKILYKTDGTRARRPASFTRERDNNFIHLVLGVLSFPSLFFFLWSWHHFRCFIIRDINFT